MGLRSDVPAASQTGKVEVNREKNVAIMVELVLAPVLEHRGVRVAIITPRSKSSYDY